MTMNGGDDVVKQGEDSKGRLYIVLYGTMLCLTKDSSVTTSDDNHYEEAATNTGKKDDEASSGYSQLSGAEREGYVFGRGTLIGIFSCVVLVCR